MKNILFNLSIVFLFALPNFSFSQNDAEFELTCEINVTHPPLSITKARLTSAVTLSDLNRQYKPSWVKTYESVEILTTHQGKLKKATGKNNILTPEQKVLLNQADENTKIDVKVLYFPENNLVQNDLKQNNFSFKVVPEIEASFIGGAIALKNYLNENAMLNLPDGCFQKNALTAVTFTVSTEGEIINTKIFESSKDDEIDAVLVNTIANMPDWKPAQYASGLKVKQDFVFTVGDMRSCVVNLLNIRAIE